MVAIVREMEPFVCNAQDREYTGGVGEEKE